MLKILKLDDKKVEENIKWYVLKIYWVINSRPFMSRFNSSWWKLHNFRKVVEIKNFKKWYYKKFITPYTALIDVTQTEDEILSLMKPKWRYNIKLASKKWVKVQKVEKTDENIKIYYDLMMETTSRDNFSEINLNIINIF